MSTDQVLATVTKICQAGTPQMYFVTSAVGYGSGVTFSLTAWKGTANNLPKVGSRVFLSDIKEINGRNRANFVVNATRRNQ